MNALRVLYLEENPDHIAIVAETLQSQYPGTHVETTDQLADAVTCIQKQHYDVILANNVLHNEPLVPQLFRLTTVSGATPIVLIAGSGDEKSAANAIKHGASDYLLKSRESLEVLPYLIQRLLKKRRVGPDHRVAPPAATTGTADQLLSEIDLVSKRVHSLQDTGPSQAAVATLREEVQRLQQFANQLAKSGKTRKSK